MRGQRWKYIRYQELSGADELYDLENDPYEMTNLIDDPKAREQLSKMRERLRALEG